MAGAMDDTAREAKELLLRKRRRLVELCGTAENEQRGLREKRSADWVDQASEEGAALLLERLSERDREMLGEIDAALARIERGSYGACQECGGAIERGRLQAVPEARLCLACSG